MAQYFGVPIHAVFEVQRSSSVSKTHLGSIVKEIGPFVFALIAALALLTYVPGLCTWLPEVLKK